MKLNDLRTVLHESPIPVYEDGWIPWRPSETPPGPGNGSPPSSPDHFPPYSDPPWGPGYPGGGGPHNPYNPDGQGNYPGHPNQQDPPWHWDPNRDGEGQGGWVPGPPPPELEDAQPTLPGRYGDRPIRPSDEGDPDYVPPKVSPYQIIPDPTGEPTFDTPFQIDPTQLIPGGTPVVPDVNLPGFETPGGLPPLLPIPAPIPGLPGLPGRLLPFL